MAFCTSCGKEINSGVRFCNNCGADQNPTGNTCTGCGKALEENEKFCSDCGTPVGAKAETKTEPQKQTPPQPKEEKYTKEGRKIISGGPKSAKNKQATPTPPPVNTQQKKKKKGCRGCALTSILILAGLIVGTMLLYNKVSDWWQNIDLEEKAENLLDTEGIDGIVDIEEGDVSHLPENRNKTAQKDATGTKKVVLDPNENSSADKYRYGIDVDPDPYKALDYYEHLVSKGDPNAMVQLADYYEQGIWVDKNTKKATELLKRAAENGSVQAEWELEYLQKSSKN